MRRRWRPKAAWSPEAGRPASPQAGAAVCCRKVTPAGADQSSADSVLTRSSPRLKLSLYIFIYSVGWIMKKEDLRTRGRAVKSVIAVGSGCLVAALAMTLAPLAVHADPLDPAVVNSWMAMATATQAQQPHWMTPLVLVTPRLEQELRWDFYDQQNGTGSQGNGQHIYNYGGPGGLRAELIPTPYTEVILAAPSAVNAWGPKGVGQGPGDWPLFLVKDRFFSANEENGNYILSGFFQMSAPLFTPGKISNNLLVAQPTLAGGKGWGDFDIEMTISQQYPIDAYGIGSTSKTLSNFGDPVLWNTVFQYHFLRYFWPELEVNYEYWPNGEHSGLS